MSYPEWSRQDGYEVRFGWGPPAVEALGGEAVVIVDVLRFSTAVEAATSRGARVYPFRWRDDSAAAFARTVGAVLADGADPAGPSLSPEALLDLPDGEAVVLPSPNGSTCATLAGERQATVVAACLRNAAAVARRVGQGHGTVSVVACGERWPDGSLRPALEDVLGAGAVLAHLRGAFSPDARAAVAAWLDAAPEIEPILAGCPSGLELIGRGAAADVRYAAAVNVSTVVPVLRDGAFEAAGPDARLDPTEDG